MNSNKDIYFEGKIYTQCKGTKHSLDCDMIYVVIGPHSFKDDEDVSGRYELEYQCRSVSGGSWLSFPKHDYEAFTLAEKRIVAVALPSPTTETPVCEYCEGKGYFINEDHKNYPEYQQKLDCYHCTPSPSKEAEVRAKELFDKFCQTITGECPHTPYCDETVCQWKGMTYCKMTQQEAKQCALICVDEILSCNADGLNPNGFWMQVKTAINQL